MVNQMQPSGHYVTLIHFVYPTSDASPPDWRIACMPNMVEFHSTPYHPNYQRSDDPRAVSCPACKRTEVYKKSRDRNG